MSPVDLPCDSSKTEIVDEPVVTIKGLASKILATGGSVLAGLAFCRASGSAPFGLGSSCGCLASGLAYYLSIKHSPERTESLRLLYEDELQRALTEDGQRTSLYISPQTFYGDGV